jgi:hemoglobin
MMSAFRVSLAPFAVAVVSCALAACASAQRPADVAAATDGTTSAPSSSSGSSSSSSSSDKRSLYERLGGKPALEAVAADLIANVAADKRINWKFADADLPRLQRLLVEQLCEATGGPCKYTGRDMKTAHKNMRIDDAGWAAVVDDLTKTLDKFKVPEAERAELFALLGPMKGDIVEPDPIGVHDAPPKEGAKK